MMRICFGLENIFEITSYKLDLNLQYLSNYANNSFHCEQRINQVIKLFVSQVYNVFVSNANHRQKVFIGQCVVRVMSHTK